MKVINQQQLRFKRYNFNKAFLFKKFNYFKLANKNNSNNGQKGLLLSKKVNLLLINLKINNCFNAFQATNKKVFLSQNLYSQQVLTSILQKNLMLVKFGLKKQYIYLLFDIILSLSQIEKQLSFNEIFSYSSKFRVYDLISKKICFQIILGQELKNSRQSNLALIIGKKFSAFFTIINYFKILNHFLTPFNQRLYLVSKFIPIFFILDRQFLIEKELKKYSDIDIRTILKRKYLINYLNGNLKNWKLFLDKTQSFFWYKLNLNDKRLNLLLNFKKGGLNFNYIKKFKLKYNSSNFLTQKNYEFNYKGNHSKSNLYVLSKIYDKMVSLNKFNDLKNNLISLQNFFYTKNLQKLNMNSKFNLGSRYDFEDLKAETVSYDFNAVQPVPQKATKTALESDTKVDSDEEVILSNWTIDDLLFSTLTDQEVINFTTFLKEKNSKSFLNKFFNIKAIKAPELNFDEDETEIETRNYWSQHKLVTNHTNYKLENIHKYFSLVLKSNVSLVFINALALTKYAYNYAATKKGAQRFLNYIEREMIQRYKYIAVYIQDFIRVCFFSFFLKKPTFVAQFMGFQLAELPRNRKETRFIRFLIKVLKIFGAQRPEILAIKVEFKGRVNRWRRTKVIRGFKGVIPFFRYTTKIEYGSGKAVTRKGALGIRLWISYTNSYNKIFKNIILSYFDYSRQLKIKTIAKYLYKFKSNPYKL